ncbi:hypothetical protein [Bacillus sp. 3255]|nr:hypothetical protein [Bacillus sp. 3255]MDR6884944.1 hypothetical protein [Bacillus sp. 3255]
MMQCSDRAYEALLDALGEANGHHSRYSWDNGLASKLTDTGDLIMPI